jgi:hypothetical protein
VEDEEFFDGRIIQAVDIKLVKILGMFRILAFSFTLNDSEQLVSVKISFEGFFSHKAGFVIQHVEV